MTASRIVSMRLRGSGRQGLRRELGRFLPDRGRRHRRRRRTPPPRGLDFWNSSFSLNGLLMKSSAPIAIRDWRFSSIALAVTAMILASLPAAIARIGRIAS